MKRGTVFLVVILLLASLLSVTAFAEGTVYNIDELKISIKMPDGYTVLTRNMDSNDPIFALSGLQGETVLAFMQENGVYIDAFDENAEHEVLVQKSVYDDSFDLDSLSSKDQQDFLTGYKSGIEAQGFTVESVDFYQQSQRKTAKAYYTSQDDDATHYIQYSFMYGNEAIKVTMLSYSSGFDPENEALCKDIVDSVRFYENIEKSTPNVPASTAAKSTSENDNVERIATIISLIILTPIANSIRRKIKSKKEQNK